MPWRRADRARRADRDELEEVFDGRMPRTPSRRAVRAPALHAAAAVRRAGPGRPGTTDWPAETGGAAASWAALGEGGTPTRPRAPATSVYTEARARSRRATSTPRRSSGRGIAPPRD